MANAVEICNLALSHVGSSAIISSIAPPDGSVEAGHCSRFYALSRQIMLTSFEWQFATKRVALAEVDNPSSVWAFAYAKPSDCIKPLRLFKSGATDEQDGADYEMEDGLILTNEEDAVLKYTRDVTDTTKFTPEFVSALSWTLASYIAGPIIKGNEGANASMKLLERAMAEGKRSAAADANRSSSTHGGQIPLFVADR